MAEGRGPCRRLSGIPRERFCSFSRGARPEKYRNTIIKEIGISARLPGSAFRVHMYPGLTAFALFDSRKSLGWRWALGNLQLCNFQCHLPSPWAARPLNTSTQPVAPVPDHQALLTVRGKAAGFQSS
eukprot:4502-Rhodomonas_salina.1